MKKHKIFVPMALHEKVHDYLQQHCEYERWDQEERATRQQILDSIAGVEGVLTLPYSFGMINHELFERAPSLRVVGTISVGYDHYDIEAMKERGIVGIHTPHVLDDSVADLVLGLIISCARRMPELDHFVKKGDWFGRNNISFDDLFGLDVHHQKLGIIGMGRIGDEIAQRAVHGFDMELLYHNRNRKPEAEEKYNASYADLEKLLVESDFVVLMTPLTPETKHYISAKHFELMKETSFFINASRGGTVDEHALVDALQQKKIRGEGVDVYYEEPPRKDHPFFSMSNVVTMPHIGSSTHKTRLDMALAAARNFVAALNGDEQATVVPELRTIHR